MTTLKASTQVRITVVFLGPGHSTSPVLSLQSSKTPPGQGTSVSFLVRQRWLICELELELFAWWSLDGLADEVVRGRRGWVGVVGFGVERIEEEALCVDVKSCFLTRVPTRDRCASSAGFMKSFPSIFLAWSSILPSPYLRGGAAATVARA